MTDTPPDRDEKLKEAVREIAVQWRSDRSAFEDSLEHDPDKDRIAQEKEDQRWHQIIEDFKAMPERRKR